MQSIEKCRQIVGKKVQNPPNSAGAFTSAPLEVPEVCSIPVHRMRLGEHATGLALKLRADGYARLVIEWAMLRARAIFSVF